MTRTLTRPTDSARATLEYYQELTQNEKNDLQETVIDLVADLQHLLCQEEIDISYVFNLAKAHYDDETPKAHGGWNTAETHLVSQWLTKDSSLDSMVTSLASECLSEATDDHAVDNGLWTTRESASFFLADRLRGFIESGLDPAGITLYSDLLRGAIANVDWHQLAESYLARE